MRVAMRETRRKRRILRLRVCRCGVLACYGNGESKVL